MNENENQRGNRLGTVSGKTICHWGCGGGGGAVVKKVLRCTNLTFALQGSCMNKQMQVVLVN